MSFYPPLPTDAIWALDVILQNTKEDPLYLADEDCPYSPADVLVLTRLAGAQPVELDDDDAEETGTKWERLQRESDKLFKGLTKAGTLLEHKDNSEKMAYFRTATQLLDKIVSIQERAANLQKIHAFHDLVLTIMEDVLDAGQRTDVMARLRTNINPEG